MAVMSLSPQHACAAPVPSLQVRGHHPAGRTSRAGPRLSAEVGGGTVPHDVLPESPGTSVGGRTQVADVWSLLFPASVVSVHHHVTAKPIVARKALTALCADELPTGTRVVVLPQRRLTIQHGTAIAAHIALRGVRHHVPPKKSFRLTFYPAKRT